MTVIAFATYEDSGGFTSDDHQLVLALRERGVAVEPVVWDDPHIDWRRFPLVVIRSVWDYHRKANRFREWVSTFLAHPGQLWNPPAAVLGNMNKGYLLDLAAAGHSVVPTTYVAAGSGLKLQEIMESHGWTQAVIKPAVSAGREYSDRGLGGNHNLTAGISLWDLFQARSSGKKSSWPVGFLPTFTSSKASATSASALRKTNAS